MMQTTKREQQKFIKIRTEESESPERVRLAEREMALQLKDDKKIDEATNVQAVIKANTD